MSDIVPNVDNLASKELVQETSATITGMIPSTAGLATETDLQTVSGALSNYEQKITYGYDENEAITAINNSAIGGTGGASYIAGQGIKIENDTISISSDNCSVTGTYAFAEGSWTNANGKYSHAEGNWTSAIGDASHAEGFYTIAGSEYMHVGGKYNKTSANALFVIGNGNYYSNIRSDAFIIYPDGSVSAAGKISADGVELGAGGGGGDYVPLSAKKNNYWK